MKINGIGVTSPDQEMKIMNQGMVRIGGDVLGAYVAEFHKRGISFNYAR